MIKVCFVCTGNTCRSVMAERIMKKKLKDFGIKDIKVNSKGIYANGENISENAKNVLKQMNISSANRKSVKLGKIDKNTLYVTMTDSQKQMIKSDNVISFKSLIGKEIGDPYGFGEDFYKDVANDIETGIVSLIEKIKSWRELW